MHAMETAMRTCITGVKLLLFLFGFSTLSSSAHAQLGPGRQRSSNLQLVAHVPMASVTSLEIERELSRPYAYVSRGSTTGWDGGRVRVQQGGPNYDLGAIIFVVTGLPDPKTVKEVARIREPEFPGGFHEHYMYKHSDGSAAVCSTAWRSGCIRVRHGASAEGRKGTRGKDPAPDDRSQVSLGRLPRLLHCLRHADKQDKFYGAGLNGYYVYDITDLTKPQLITSITGVSGMDIAHTFTPDPLGRYAVTEMEYEMAPLRIFDLKPKGDGQNFVGNINRSIGAWTPNWKTLPHNHEVRWPYVFVSGYKDGLQVLNMMDLTNPAHVAYYDTHDVPDVMSGQTGYSGGGSAWGVDVRNADGLIVISDAGSGFWAFKMDGFDGWNGHDWGMPNISSEQDWDNGPEGAPKSKPVTMLYGN
jgi:hypothetical protein